MSAEIFKLITVKDEYVRAIYGTEEQLMELYNDWIETHPPLVLDYIAVVRITLERKEIIAQRVNLQDFAGVKVKGIEVDIEGMRPER